MGCSTLRYVSPDKNSLFKANHRKRCTILDKCWLVRLISQTNCKQSGKDVSLGRFWMHSPGSHTVWVFQATGSRKMQLLLGSLSPELVTWCEECPADGSYQSRDFVLKPPCKPVLQQMQELLHAWPYRQGIRSCNSPLWTGSQCSSLLMGVAWAQCGRPTVSLTRSSIWRTWSLKTVKIP